LDKLLSLTPHHSFEWGETTTLQQVLGSLETVTSNRGRLGSLVMCPKDCSDLLTKSVITLRIPVPGILSVIAIFRQPSKRFKG
jgi:hypothetical protein